MGYSTPRLALRQGYASCSLNGRILLVILFPRRTDAVAPTCLRCTEQACRLPESSRSADASWCLRGMRVRRLQAEAGREVLGALPCPLAFFETGAVIPDVMGKGWIALDGLPTAGTFLPLEGIAELHHISSSLWLSLAAGVVHSVPAVPGRARDAHPRAGDAAVAGPSSPALLARGGASGSGRAAQTGSARCCAGVRCSSRRYSSCLCDAKDRAVRAGRPSGKSWR